MTFARVLAAVDTTHLDLLEQSALIALTFNAELATVFVEDVALIQLSRLPVAKEVRIFSTEVAPIDERRISRRMQGRAAHIRRTILTITRRYELAWSFDIRRGLVSQEVIDVSQAGDLVTIGWGSGDGRPSAIARHVMLDSPGSVLVLRHAMPSPMHIAVAYDGTQEPLDTALTLHNTYGGHVTNIILAADFDQARAYQREACGYMRSMGVEPHCRWIIDAGTADAIDMNNDIFGDLLIMPDSQVDVSFTEALWRLDASLLVNRVATTE